MRRTLPVLLLASVATAACSSGGTGGTGGRADSAVIQVVAAENFWGSIAAQVGGTHVHVISIITNPSADPHSYEPTAADARRVAGAGVVIENGLGYDPWMPKLVAGSGAHPTVIDVGRLLGLGGDSNPHRWYNPDDVHAVIAAMTSDLSTVQPADAAYFQDQRTTFERNGLAQYHRLIDSIRSKYSATPVGASESIFAMLAPALGLNLVTPPTFLRAVSEGTDVTAADKSTIDRQIADHRIEIYVYNTQNATPDVQAQLAECRSAGIPTATITETLVPATASYQEWQTTQLDGILTALEKAQPR